MSKYISILLLVTMIALVFCVPVVHAGDGCYTRTGMRAIVNSVAMVNGIRFVTVDMGEKLGTYTVASTLNWRVNQNVRVNVRVCYGVAQITKLMR